MEIFMCVVFFLSWFSSEILKGKKNKNKPLKCIFEKKYKTQVKVKIFEHLS